MKRRKKKKRVSSSEVKERKKEWKKERKKERMGNDLRIMNASEGKKLKEIGEKENDNLRA